MKPFLRAAALLFAIIIAGCGKDAQPPDAAVKHFYELCRALKTQEAYAATSWTFQTEQPAKYFDARVRDVGFNKVTAIEWQPHVEKDGFAQMLGEFTFNRGPGADENEEKASILTALASEGGVWKIHRVEQVLPDRRDNLFSIQARTVGNDLAIASKGILNDQDMPTDRVLRKIVEKSLLEFNAAVKEGAFETFFVKSISDRWKYRGKSLRDIEKDPENKDNRITRAALQRTFGGFIEAKVEMGGLAGKQFTHVEPARLTAEGVLTVIGNYRGLELFAGGQKLNMGGIDFKLEYVMEGGGWRIFGITVTLQQ